MIGAFINGKTVAVPGLRYILLGWIVAEILALALVVKVLGWGGAILLTLVTSVMGVAMLRRVGIGAAQRIGLAMAGHRPDGGVVDGTLAGLGALLLVIPGFVSDLVGLALATPSVRQALNGRLIGTGDGGRGANPSPRPRAASSDIIDLPPSDWRVVEPNRRG